MAERILVPLDGSPLSERALLYALEHFPAASVTTIHVIDPVDSLVAAEAGGLPAASDWHDAARDRADELHERAASVATDHDVDVATVTVVGRPAREIVAYADDHGIDHIVVGSHGREGLERTILGSVAERVVRRAGVPVTVTR